MHASSGAYYEDGECYMPFGKFKGVHQCLVFLLLPLDCSGGFRVLAESEFNDFEAQVLGGRKRAKYHLRCIQIHFETKIPRL